MTIARTLKRDLGSQFRQAKNLKEPVLKRAKRAFWAMVYLAKALKIAMRFTRHECVGSAVQFEGRRCFVSNWAGTAYPTLADGSGFYRERVPRSEITNVLTLRELRHRFTSGFDFYMGNWHGIDVNRRLYRTDRNGQTFDL